MAKMSSEKVIYRNIGRAVAAYRHACGFSQSEVGRTLGMDPSLLSRIEAGKRRVNGYQLARLAALFNVRVDALFGEKNG